MKNTAESPFPTYEQELLLTASLLDDGRAISAIDEWLTLIDLDGQLDSGSFRLLPLLFKNLLKHNYKGPRMNMLKGVYRLSWYKNQKLIYNSIKVLELFQKADIKTMILKGVALSSLVYKDIGVRPMFDLDILVPSHQATKAIELLKSNNWKPENDEYLEYNLRFGKGMGFKNDEDFDCDLHWHPFFEGHGKNSELDFWDNAIPLKIFDTSTLSFCYTDMLLHTFVHGIKWNKEPPIRWVADAFYLINATDFEIDWERFIFQVKKYKVVLQIKEALNYLIEKFNVEVPEEVMSELSKIRITLAEKLVYKECHKDSDDFQDNLFKKLNKLFLVYLQQSDKTNIFLHFFGFISYLRFRTKGKDNFRILAYYLRKRFRKADKTHND
ncbi:MAG: nucleotidyltransferase family protein [Saprospiraceae bacterium]|nr:nucleotidyltransferase family protein [Saprospiraceae bacterium]